MACSRNSAVAGHPAHRHHVVEFRFAAFHGSGFSFFNFEILQGNARRGLRFNILKFDAPFPWVSRLDVVILRANARLGMPL
jgi:hypothetical protein